MTKLLLGAASAALLATAASAQLPPSAIFVDSNTTTPGFGLTPDAPFATLAAAIAQAKVDLATGFPEVVVNVLPGTYTTAATLPAHGIRITAFDIPGNPGGGARPHLTESLQVDQLGDTSLRPTTIENLEFERGVELTAGGRVQIRKCRFTYASQGSLLLAGVFVQRPAGTHSEHVIEFCHFEDISGEQNSFVGVWNAGFEVVGTSSLLVRANTFHNLETAVYVIGDYTIESAVASPRVFSNAMSAHERPVDISYANPWLVNNSIDGFKDHGNAFFDDIFGVNFEFCPSYAFANNIVWFEPPAQFQSNDLGDFLASGGTGSTTVVTNYLSDNPGNSYPYAGFPRIAATSPLATGGTLAQVLPATQGGPAPIPNNSGGTVPVDVSVDFEGDMRSTPTGSATMPRVAIGADQVVDLKLSLAPGSSIDAYGNWYADYVLQPSGNTLLESQPFDVDVQGMYPGSASAVGAVALIGVVLPNPQPLPPPQPLPQPTNPIDVHLFDNQLGSTNSYWVTGPGTDNMVKPLFPMAQPVGDAQTTASFTIPGIKVSPILLGERLFLQSVSLGAGGAIGTASNRLEVRISFYRPPAGQ